MRWLRAMFNRHRGDPDQDDMHKELSRISDRSVIASKRLDDLATIERNARLRTLAIQASVLSRSSRRSKL